MSRTGGRRGWLPAAVLAVAGCTGGGAGEVMPPPAVPSAQAALPQVTSVTIETDDGVLLNSLLYGEGDRGIVLAHQLGGGKADWQPAVLPLTDAGFAVLLPDLRGHGASPGGRGENPEVDLTAAVRALRAGTGADEIWTLGTSFSGVAAITVAVQEELRGAIAVSPAQGQPPAEVDVPVLAITTEGDASAQFTREVADAVAARLVTYRGGAHGTEMLADPTLRPMLLTQLLAWLEDSD